MLISSLGTNHGLFSFWILLINHQFLSPVTILSENNFFFHAEQQETYNNLKTDPDSFTKVHVGSIFLASEFFDTTVD